MTESISATRRRRRLGAGVAPAVAGLALAAFVAAPAGGALPSCLPINSVPYTITGPGIYCVILHITTPITAGIAINIMADDVILDLGGYSLTGPGTGSAFGVFSFQRRNITVRGGRISGFARGIWLRELAPFTASGGHVVEGTHASGNRLVGIQVSGRGNSVVGNRVHATGDASAFATGIRSEGPDVRIENNDVIATGETLCCGTARGIIVYAATAAVVADNRISNTALGGANSTAIFIFEADALVVGNRISHFDFGVNYSALSSGKYRGNLTLGVTAPYIGGTDAGDND